MLLFHYFDVKYCCKFNEQQMKNYLKAILSLIALIGLFNSFNTNIFAKNNLLDIKSYCYYKTNAKNIVKTSFTFKKALNSYFIINPCINKTGLTYQYRQICSKNFKISAKVKDRSNIMGNLKAKNCITIDNQIFPNNSGSIQVLITK